MLHMMQIKTTLLLMHLMKTTSTSHETLAILQVFDFLFHSHHFNLPRLVILRFVGVGLLHCILVIAFNDRLHAGSGVFVTFAGCGKHYDSLFRLAQNPQFSRFLQKSIPTLWKSDLSARSTLNASYNYFPAPHPPLSGFRPNNHNVFLCYNPTTLMEPAL